MKYFKQFDMKAISWLIFTLISIDMSNIIKYFDIKIDSCRILTSIPRYDVEYFTIYRHKLMLNNA